jgi:hypothetical protein
MPGRRRRAVSALTASTVSQIGVATNTPQRTIAYHNSIARPRSGTTLLLPSD